MLSLRTLLPFLGAAAVPFLLAGCSSSHHSRDPFAEAVAVGERPVAMQGVGTFFGGQVVATVTVSQGVGPGTHPRKGGPNLDAQGRPAGGTHGSREYGDIGGGTSGMNDDQQRAYLAARGSLGSPLPPVTLRLVLLNRGPAPIRVDIQEVNSDLGNFAVQPEIVAVDAGQTGTPDPMISQLGVTSDTIPVKVTLSLDGKAESQTIAVKNLKTPAADQ